MRRRARREIRARRCALSSVVNIDRLASTIRRAAQAPLALSGELRPAFGGRRPFWPDATPRLRRIRRHRRGSVAVRESPLLVPSAGPLQDDLKARRARTMDRLGPDAIAIFWSAPARVYSHDVDYEYRQDSNLSTSPASTRKTRSWC